MTNPKKKPKTGDVVGWAWMLSDSVIWMGISRSDARNWRKYGRGSGVKLMRLAKLVLTK